MLAATDRMGVPDSYFRKEDLVEWATEWGIALDSLPGTYTPSEDYVCHARNAGIGDAQIFGLRLMHESLEGLIAYLHALSPGHQSDKAYLEAAFGPLTFIHLHRDDTVSQAISLLRAEQSGLWHRAQDGTDIERLTPTGQQGYDFDRIHRYTVRLDIEKAAWPCWFAAQGIKPFNLSYTQLTDNPAKALTAICDLLGVPTPASGDVRPTTSKLADAMSEEWKARYLNQLRGSRPA